MNKRLFFPATVRNRDSIAKVLAKYLPNSGNVLEIGSGSGQHGVTFQKLFSYITWYTSDIDLSARESIKAWIADQGLTDIMPAPIDLDVNSIPWDLPDELKLELNCIVCINVIHITNWHFTKHLFSESANLLNKNSFLILYGPFFDYRQEITNSNIIFDKSLRATNKSWGVRDLADIQKVGNKYGYIQKELIEMPSNNLTLVFERI